MPNPLPLFDQLLKHSSGLVNAGSWADLAHEMRIRYPGITPSSQAQTVNPRERVDPNHPFGYQHNSLGFRSHEPLAHVDVCYYGCSQTYGLGINQSARYGEQLDLLTGGVSNNFGVCGVSGEELVYMFMATSRLVKMKTAVFLLPDVPRQVMPFVSGSQVRYGSLMYTKQFEEDPACDPYREEMAAAYNAFHRLPQEFFWDRLRNQVQTLDYVAQTLGIRLVITSWSTYTYSALMPINQAANTQWLLPPFVDPSQDLARDGMHSGPKTHLAWARSIHSIL